MERGRAPSAVVAAGRPDLNFFEKQGDLRTPEEWGAHGTGGEDGQRKLDFEEVLFVTAGNRGLAGLGDLPQCVNAEFVWVGGNSLRSITAVAPLLQLRLLDASKNALQVLPDESFFAQLPFLSVLFLHNNNIGKVKCVTGLAGAHALRVLTLHSNPVSESPAYRAVLLSMCPGLLALDGAVRSDVDTLPSAHRLVPPLSAFASLHRSGLPALPLLDQASSLEAHALAHLRMLLGAHRVYATAGAPLIIQRVFRGHLERRRYFEEYRIVVPALLKIQRWLLRIYIVRKVVPAVRAAVSQGPFAVARALTNLPPSAGSSGWLRDSVGVDRDLVAPCLYFFPEDYLAIRAVLDGCAALFSGYSPPLITAAPVVCARDEHSARQIVPGCPLMRGLIARLEHAHRSPLSLLSLLRLRASPHILQIVAFSVIRPRGYKTSTHERRLFWEGVAHVPEPLQPGRSRLLQVHFNQAASLARFISVILVLNLEARNVADAHAAMLPIRFLLPEAIARVAAAVSIQSAFRAASHRRRLQPSLATALLALRSARLIQAWWRVRVLRARLACLSATKRRLTAITSPVLYLVHPRQVQSQFRAQAGKPRFTREGRVGFRIQTADDAVALFPYLLQRDQVGGALRALIPDWLGLSIPVEPADISFQAEWRGAASSEMLTSLVYGGAKQSHPLTQGTQAGSPRGFFSLEGHRVPRPGSLGEAAVVRVEYPSVEEARRRVALLIIHTWTAKKKRPVRLLTLQESLLHLHAICIQAAFRGYVARRWFRPLRRHLEKHLQTSLLDEKRASWIAHGTHPAHVYDEWMDEEEGARNPLASKHSRGVWAGRSTDTMDLHIDNWEIPKDHVEMEADRQRARAEDGALGRIDSDMIMSLQSENLRLAGLRPATAPFRRLVESAEDKRYLAAESKLALDHEVGQAREERARVQDRTREHQRLQRETAKVHSALRARPAFSLRLLHQRPPSGAARSRAAETERQAWREVDSSEQARASIMRQVLQAKATDKSKLVLDQRERTQRLRLATASTTSSRPSRFSPASDADGNTAGGGQSRPLSSSRRPTSAAARAAAPELVARFTSTVNMVGMHMQRAEVERAVSQDMIETQYNVAQKREAKSLAVEATRRHKLERQTQSSHSHQVEKEALRAFLDDTRGKPAVRNIRIQRRHNTPLTPAGRDSRGSGGQLSTGRVVDTDDERSTTSVARGWKGGDSPATPFEVMPGMHL